MDKKQYQKEYHKTYYLNNKAKIDEKNKKYAKAHPDRIVKTVQAYVKRNKGLVSAYNAAYTRNAQGRFRTLIYRATERGLMIDITFEQFKVITSLPCRYCGTSPEYVGIDRIDNNKGYLFSNAAPCCKSCNMMKKDMSVFDFLSHVQKIVTHENSKRVITFTDGENMANNKTSQ